MAACPTAPSPSAVIPGIAGCTTSCDQIEAGTAVHAGVTDCRSNAPEIALGRPLLVEKRHCESCTAAFEPSTPKKLVPMSAQMTCSRAVRVVGAYTIAFSQLWRLCTVFLVCLLAFLTTLPDWVFTPSPYWQHPQMTNPVSIPPTGPSSPARDAPTTVTHASLTRLDPPQHSQP